MLRSTSTTQGVNALSSGESEFYALVKGTSAGLEEVSMLKDLGVDISINIQIDKAVLEVRIDASAGRGIAVRRGAGRSRHIATPTLWVQKLTQEYRTRRILEPNTLTADQFEEHSRGVTEEGLESRCGQVDDACEIDNRIDDESSVAVQLKTAEGPNGVNPPWTGTLHYTNRT